MAVPTTRKWEKIAEETKCSSRTLNLARRPASEEVIEKLTRSLDALALAINKVQEAKMHPTNFTADLLVRKTNTDTIKVCEQAKSILQRAKGAIVHNIAPAQRPLAAPQKVQSTSLGK